MNDAKRVRLRFIIAAIFAASCILVGRLYVVSIISGKQYAYRADRQYGRSGDYFWDRGTIYFEGKGGELYSAATMRDGYTVAIDPRAVGDKEILWRDLSRFIRIDRDTFFAKASKVGDPYEELIRDVSAEEALELTRRRFPGVIVRKERYRYYPGNTLGAHILGFIAEGEDGEVSGKYGLERYYDYLLQRRRNNHARNAFAQMFRDAAALVSGESVESDIITTIEPKVQDFLERTLQKINELWSAEQSGGIILVPETGEVRALASYPTFNSNRFREVSSLAIFSNPIVENVFEFGSIVKPLTVAAGLDSESIKPDSIFIDTGSVVVDGQKISNVGSVAKGKVDTQGILNHSLNTGAVQIVERIGKEKFAKYFISFGIGEETGIDIPSETKGLIENLSSPRYIEYATASFGQGIALTPIGMARSLAILANGGYLTTPHIVKTIDYRIGARRRVDVRESKQVIRKDTADTVTKMLVNVVDKALLQGNFRMERYQIAAKTGTAQIAKEGGGGYYDDRFLHSFFGYFPASDPKFLVFLYSVNPKKVGFASQSLTASFMDITKFLLSYYDIPPDR